MGKVVRTRGAPLVWEQAEVNKGKYGQRREHVVLPEADGRCLLAPREPRLTVGKVPAIEASERLWLSLRGSLWGFLLGVSSKAVGVSAALRKGDWR